MKTDRMMRRLTSRTTTGPWYVLAMIGGAFGIVQAKDNWEIQLLAKVPRYSEEPATVQDLENADFIAAAREWVPDALERIEKIRKLHKPRVIYGKECCGYCSEEVAAGVWEYTEPWPCEHVRILDNEN